MTCKWAYATPDGFDDIIMSGEGEYLTGLWFQGSKGASVTEGCEEKFLPVFKELAVGLRHISAEKHLILRRDTSLADRRSFAGSSRR